MSNSWREILKKPLTKLTKLECKDSVSFVSGSEEEPASRTLDDGHQQEAVCEPDSAENLSTRLESPREPDSTALPLKGHVVELWRDDYRFFLVADETDAREAIQRFGVSRGEIWTRGELELVARVQDQTLRNEIEKFKRQMHGCLRSERR
jgi:hypothetical protein